MGNTNSTTFAIRGDIVYPKTPTAMESLENSVLVCADGRVEGLYRELPGRFQGIRVLDHSGRLVMPGLCDLHLHAPQYPFRGLGMDLELLDWLEAHTFPEEARYADPTYAEAAYRRFAEDLTRSPTTRASIFATVHLPATGLLCDLLEGSGLSVLVGKVNMDRNCPEGLREDTATSLRDTRSWLESAARYKRVRPILTPRFVPSCTDELMEGLGELRRETGLLVQSHLSENPSEVEWVRTLCPYADSYGAAYDYFGLLEQAIMAHCVHCTEEEIALMGQRMAVVAHCPQSNTNLSSGIAPVRRFLQAGVRVGLGTDIAGGHSLSMLRAMADTVQVSKLRWRLVENSGPALSMAEAFYLAARGAGVFGRVGAFEPGFAFDVLVIDDSALTAGGKHAPRERLERLAYLPEGGRILEKYVEGSALNLGQTN